MNSVARKQIQMMAKASLLPMEMVTGFVSTDFTAYDMGTLQQNIAIKWVAVTICISFYNKAHVYLYGTLTSD